jgi:hypothetical protein
VRRAVLTPVAATLLGAAAAAWCAVPVIGKGWAGFALFAVVACVFGSAVRLAVAWIPLTEETYLLPGPIRAWLTFLRVVRLPPWEEGAVVAALALEALHPARPWHTALLGAVLTAYLLTVHLADSGAPASTLSPQVPVLAAGGCLLALGAGAGLLPAIAPGPGSALLRVVAAVAVILAAGLVLPHIGARRG